jgi:hypothetical protein
MGWGRLETLETTEYFGLFFSFFLSFLFLEQVVYVCACVRVCVCALSLFGPRKKVCRSFALLGLRDKRV